MNNLLEINSLKKSFGGIHAINDVSFEIRQGELLGLIGPNGSGKSTCVNLISGTYTLDSGSILFKGKEISGLSIQDRVALGLGRTFQSPRPFVNLTVFESVFTIALQRNTHKAAHEKATEILKRMDMLDLKDMRSGRLPIEKRKWLDLARVLANDPEFIMLDEVMSGLNPAEMDRSLELVRRINEEGMTVLFIEHVMSAVMKLCSRLIVMNEGTLLCEGDPQEVITSPEVITAYLGKEFKNA